MRNSQNKKVIITLSPQKSLRDFTGQAGGCRGKKVIIAMSGGIDSSVAAALLKKAGYSVTGVFMRLYNSPRFKESEKRAKKVAKVLNIPFLILDLRKEFQKKIINYFLKEYATGLTPNPCVVCNKEIKFKSLMKKASVQKADYVATGHYVKIIKSNSTFKLLRAKDKEKDQSYFLWQLSQEQLKKIVFPLGDLTKSQVKNLAKKSKLPVSGISESQEICFIQTHVNTFLKHHLKEKPSRIIDTKGKTIGQHQGLAFYTIGQRKGIGLPGGPYFVLGKDLKRNFLIATKNGKDLFKKELIAGKVDWASGREPKLPLEVKAKIRYRQKTAPATIFKIQDSKFKILFNSPQRAITPGQSVVFYQGNELLGGGIIE